MNKIWAAMLISVSALMAMPLAQAAEEVARSIITTAVVDREPVDDLEVVSVSNDTVFFFTDLRNMQGQTILHRWLRGDEQIAEVSFDVGGPRWRIWSSKKMLPEWTGGWTVQVVNGAGEVVAEKSFTYGLAEDVRPKTSSEEQAPVMEEKPMTEEAPTSEEAPMMEEAPAAGGQSGTGATE